MLKLKSFAKINLCLALKEKRKDGYHNIESIMQTISLHDKIKLKKHKKTLCKLKKARFEKIPTNEKNLAIKAANLFFSFLNLKCGVKIIITKKIPTQAGLGGASSNAAAVICGLNILYKTNLSYNTLLYLAKKIGADVPFFIKGGTAIAKGIGEKINNITPIKKCYIVVVKPNFSISTKEAYNTYSQMKPFENNEIKNLVSKIEGNENFEEIAKYMFNNFEQVLNIKDIFKIKDKMLSFGAKTSMLTGSGSCVFAIFSKKKEAKLANIFFKNQNLKSFLCKPIKKYFKNIE